MGVAVASGMIVVTCCGTISFENTRSIRNGAHGSHEVVARGERKYDGWASQVAKESNELPLEKRRLFFHS